MGIRTRGVSLSLESLGISVPRSNSSNTNSASRANRSLSNAAQSSSAGNNAHNANDAPAPKRVKRSHTNSSSSSASSSANAAAPGAATSSRHASSASTSTQKSVAAVTAINTTETTTPPPSPGRSVKKVDTQGINDDIVVGVIELLESTGNRPHLIRELATILANRLKSVESSSNPQAIISSRLTNYLRRPWTALAPCPLTKEQVMVHPRRVYYFLTTCPRQEIPEFSDSPTTARVISPSVSSGPEDDYEMDATYGEEVVVEAEDQRQRQALSPSPELEFDNLDLDLTAHMSSQPEPPPDYGNSRIRAQSPPLEYDEREFTQTASSMQAQKNAGLKPVVDISFSGLDLDGYSDSLGYTLSNVEENDEIASHHNHQCAAALFGAGHLLSAQNHQDAALFSSPMMRPTTFSPMLRAKDTPLGQAMSTPSRKAADYNWVLGDICSPEHVDLNELDDMLSCI